MKIPRCLLACASLCAFFVTTNSLRLDYDNVDWADLKNKAMWAGKLVASNKELARNAPSFLKFLSDIAVGVKGVNPVYAASSIYSIGKTKVSKENHLEKKKNTDVSYN